MSGVCVLILFCVVALVSIVAEVRRFARYDKDANAKHWNKSLPDDDYDI